jgi:transcriptional regulator of acetoin/glycerol metabolism
MLPPLRERQDLDWLAERMLAEGPGEPTGLSPAARAALHAHDWPGNLRELRNAIDYACSVCNDGMVQPVDLPEGVTQATASTTPRAPHRPGAALAQGLAHPLAPSGADTAADLRAQLVGAHWNVSAVARALGCSRMTLYRRMKRLGIQSPLHDMDA